MSRNEKNKKNPLVSPDLSEDKKREIIDEVWRTEYLINGLRYAISSGMKISIFDRIVKISKDGIGKITKKSIEDFIEEFSEDCVPSYELPEAIVEDFEGNEYNIENPDLSISGHSIRCMEFQGKEEYRDYIKGLVGYFIINSIHSRVCTNNYNDTKRFFIDSQEDPSIKYKDWVIDPNQNSFSFEMNNEDIVLLRKDLMFYELVGKYGEECARDHFGHEVTIKFYDKCDQPFKSLLKKSYKAYNISRPTNPELTEEALMRGIETYCFNNQLSLHFSQNKNGTVPNENYALVISELRKALNNILKLYGSENG